MTGNYDFGLSSQMQILKFDARSGEMKVMNGEEEVTFKKASFDMDLEGLKTGQCAYLSGQGLIFHEGVKSSRPDPIDGQDFRPGFVVTVYSEDMPEDLDEELGLREISSTALVMRRAFSELCEEYVRERDNNPGCVPVVEVKGFKKITMKKGVAFAPKMSIIGWNDRRPEFDGNTSTETGNDNPDI